MSLGIIHVLIRPCLFLLHVFLLCHSSSCAVSHPVNFSLWLMWMNTVCQWKQTNLVTLYRLNNFSATVLSCWVMHGDFPNNNTPRLKKSLYGSFLCITFLNKFRHISQFLTSTLLKNRKFIPNIIIYHVTVTSKKRRRKNFFSTLKYQDGSCPKLRYYA